jgi:polysaccharide pyruvyl transferase WcaK-like protein
LSSLEAKELLAATDFVITSRYYFALSALTVSQPVALLRTSETTCTTLSRLYNVPSLCLNPASSNNTTALEPFLSEHWRNRSNIRAKLQRRQILVQSLAMNNALSPKNNTLLPESYVVVLGGYNSSAVINNNLDNE